MNMQCARERSFRQVHRSFHYILAHMLVYILRRNNGAGAHAARENEGERKKGRRWIMVRRKRY